MEKSHPDVRVLAAGDSAMMSPVNTLWMVQYSLLTAKDDPFIIPEIIYRVQLATHPKNGNLSSLT